MTTATPAPKRRRLNDALHKPFKSPFRTPLKPTSNPAVVNGISAAPTPASLSSAENKPSEATVAARLQHPASPGGSPQPQTQPATSRRPPMRLPPTPLSADSLTPSQTAHLTALTATTRTLDRRIHAVRQDVDTLTQALRIESSGRDNELETLIQKWKEASRAAAEEVFGRSKDRVNRMGGVGAWREREREGRERMRAWVEEGQAGKGEGDEDEDDDEDEGEDGVDVEARAAREEARVERKRRREEMVDERTELEKEEQEDQVEEAGGADDDAFTMDMMLKTMNIDLTVIGWDKEGQRWIG
ncbi:hypothetical protein W97_09088 [Coniosporium apollinis CBS 100218]|uniref:DNA repair protein Dds20/Mei5 n=1 Tax=Coniosporium apollinis (strain CBS 100218) TaxID=1168221 RepID=R7Z6K6_CONA1|nr:uncharacterized protein W97_09088 [Coniosporium apollinis CBS 100218]EON69825.1 hypothetical protein W97_09088 [Coniosporium apollinis CBS 100218]